MGPMVRRLWAATDNGLLHVLGGSMGCPRGLLIVGGVEEGLEDDEERVSSGVGGSGPTGTNRG